MGKSYVRVLRVENFVGEKWGTKKENGGGGYVEEVRVEGE